MTPTGVAAVNQRIADIQARFRPSPGFHAALEQAEVARDGDPAAAGTAETAVKSAQRSAPAAESGTSARPASAADAGAEAPGWAERLPAAGRQWAPMIERAAAAAGVEPELLAALTQAESGFDPSARSRAGAIGLAQLMPGTASALGVDPVDPEQNLVGGARYLREQLDRFGAADLALAAYNAGPQRVAQAGGIPRIAETQAYVETVRANYEALR